MEKNQEDSNLATKMKEFIKERHEEWLKTQGIKRKSAHENLDEEDNEQVEHVEQNSGKDSEPKLQAKGKKFKRKAKGKTQPKAKGKANAKPKADPKAEPEPKPKDEPKVEPEPKAEPKPKTKGKAKGKAKAKPKVDPKAEPEPKPKDEPEPKAETKPAAKGAKRRATEPENQTMQAMTATHEEKTPKKPESKKLMQIQFQRSRNLRLAAQLCPTLLM